MAEVGFTAVLALDALPADTQKAVDVDGRSILLCHHDGRIFAVENLCSHAEQPLECGRVKWGWIACPFHGARFDLKTGEALNPPAINPIATFVVRIADGMIEIAV